MIIKVDEIEKRARIEFNHEDFILCESDNKDLGDYSLNHRIYLDYKDSIQVGMPCIYLRESEAKRLETILDKTY